MTYKIVTGDWVVHCSRQCTLCLKTREYTIKRWLVIPPLLTNVSALTGETCTPQIAFSVMLYTMSQK